MKKLFLPMLAMLTILLLISGCGTSQTGTSQTATSQGTAANEDPYLIGVLTAQTGRASWLGDGELKSANMIADEVNAQGGIDGHPIKIVAYDSASSPEQAVNGASKLIGDGVLAILGPSLVAESKAVAPLVKDQGPLAYSLSGGYRPENRWMFASSVQTEIMLQTIFDYFKTKGITKFALLTSTDATGQEAVDALPGLLAEDKSISMVASERVNPADLDASVQLSSLTSKQPQAIISWMTGKLTNIVVKNFYQTGLDIPFIVSHGNLSYVFVEDVKEFEPKTLLIPATKDFVWESLPDSDPQKAINGKLHRDYESKYGKRADYGPASAYDAMNLIIDGLREVGPDKEKLRTFIESTKNRPGAQAIYNFSAEDHRGTGRNDTVMIQVKDGQFQAAP